MTDHDRCRTKEGEENGRMRGKGKVRTNALPDLFEVSDGLFDVLWCDFYIDHHETIADLIPIKKRRIDFFMQGAMMKIFDDTDYHTLGSVARMG